MIIAGGISIIMANFNIIALSFIHRPHLTFSWFSKEPDQFNSWISRMPYTLFTDHIGNQSQKLNNLKTEMIKALKRYLNVPNENISNVRKFINKGWHGKAWQMLRRLNLKETNRCVTH